MFIIRVLALVLASFFVAFVSDAQNKSILKVGETLKLSEKLISPNGKYEFRSLLLAESSYNGKGLWDYNVGSVTIVSIFGKPANLKFDEKGSIVLYNTEGKVIWSSASNYPNVSELRLQDDGNLVIYDTNNDPIWALKDPKTGEYDSGGGNGFFIKYKGDSPDPSRNSNQTVDLESIIKNKN